MLRFVHALPVPLQAADVPAEVLVAELTAVYEDRWFDLRTGRGEGLDGHHDTEPEQQVFERAVGLGEALAHGEHAPLRLGPRVFLLGVAGLARLAVVPDTVLA